MIRNLGLIPCSLSAENPSIVVITTLAAIALLSADEDLIDATISELNSLSTSRKLAEDPQDTTTDILYVHGISTGDEDQARVILEQSVHDNPTNMQRRIKLAKMLLASGQSQLASSVIDVNLDPSEFRQSPIIGQGSETQSEVLRLKGIASVKNGDTAAGRSDLQRAVRVTPWDDSAWVALAISFTAVPEA